MDYSGYKEFPFPSSLTNEGNNVRNFFLSLPDEEQLKLLNGSCSYDSFYLRVRNRMAEVNC
ncbi:MAG TPA: hypothetical protein VHP31_10390 [Caproicibacter sp.]|nr:hypothetical protein [Caproicibacter sp.]